MYKGSNPTAKKSQQWLVEATVSLMHKMPYEKIMIMDICRQAGLARQTFYNCFDAKDDVLRLLLRQKYEAEFAHYAEKETIAITDVVAAFERVIETNRPILRLMIENRLDYIITDEICRCISLFAGRFATQKSGETLDYGIAFLGGALSQTVICWFKDANAISADELSALLLAFFDGSYFTIRK